MKRMRQALVWTLLMGAIGTDAADVQSERVLRFPSTYAVGKVFSKAETERHRTKHFDYRDDGVTWRFLAVAQGRVVIPPGQHVHLQLYLPALRHPYALDFLERLGPEDLYMLSSVDEACIARIGHLQGLRWIHFAPGIAPEALGRIAALSRLERVFLPAGLTDAGVAEIAKCGGLKGLYFDKNWVTDAGVAHLAQLKNLEELELGGDFMGDEALKFLYDLDHLRYLSLWGSFSDEALQYVSFANALETARINITTHMDSGGVRGIGDEGVRHLALSLTLKDIALERCEAVSALGLRHLQAMGQLRKLDIRGAAVDDAGLQLLAAFPKLEYLNLPDSGITDEGVARLRALPQLRHLSVGRSAASDLSDDTLKVVCSLEHLESLAIGGSKLSNLGLGLIGSMPALTDLWLNTQVPVTDHGIKHLNRLTRLRTLAFGPETTVPLKTLSRLRLAGLETLACQRLLRNTPKMQLGDLVSLQELDLGFDTRSPRNNVFRDQDVQSLVGLRHLRDLRLQAAGITDAGLSYLTGLTELEVLVLGGSAGITEKGLARLPAERLRHLVIADSRVPDAGLLVLKRQRALETLRIASPAIVGSEATRALKDALPLLTQLQIN